MLPCDAVNHKQCHLNINPRSCPVPPLHPPLRCLIKDFELRPNVLDLLQHVFIKQIVGKEKILQKQLIELIDLNQQIGVIEKTRYCLSATRFLAIISLPGLCDTLHAVPLTHFSPHEKREVDEPPCHWISC